MALDPGGGQTVLFNAYNISAQGYTGGQVGAFGWTTGRRLDDARLWIDESGGSFNHGFPSATITPSHDDNGNLTDDGVCTSTSATPGTGS